LPEDHPDRKMVVAAKDLVFGELMDLHTRGLIAEATDQGRTDALWKFQRTQRHAFAFDTVCSFLTHFMDKYEEKANVLHPDFLDHPDVGGRECSWAFGKKAIAALRYLDDVQCAADGGNLLEGAVVEATLEKFAEGYRPQSAEVFDVAVVVPAVYEAIFKRTYKVYSPNPKPKTLNLKP
jgi:hypothetical protein